VGDLDEQTIRLLMLAKEEQNEQLKRMGKEMEIIYDDSWRGSIHYFNKKITSLFNTHLEVKKYKPAGFLHTELKCIDPEHPNCDYVKVIHDLI
jgi:hypothetical protein